MSCEITVILKDSERTYRQKFLSYAKVVLDEDDPIIKECIAASQKNFNGEPEDIQIRALLIVR